MDDEPDISIVIPAHNEEDYLPKCLSSIARNSQVGGLNVETVVSLNRCTDNTEKIAADFGAMLVREDAKNIARIRNAGVRASRAPIVATIDADSYLSEGTLAEIVDHLSDPGVDAGGADFRAERDSLPIRISYAVAKLMAKRAGGSMALYWFRRRAFEAIDGFDETRHIGEDIDFSSRLRAYVEQSGSRYVMLRKSFVVTSCRKFDEFGDWYAIKLALFGGKRVQSMMAGDNPADMDKYYYETRKKGGKGPR